MFKNFTFFSLLMFLVFQVTAQTNPNFYLAPNGMTCMCPDAAFGESGTITINGLEKTFTKRTEADLRALINTDELDPEIALTCTSGITNMSLLFQYKNQFNQDISSWDVSSVTDMRDMFDFATSFNQPLDNWDVSSVTNMRWMFNNAFSFNQPLDNWDVSSVIDMRSMFFSAESFNQPLDNWDVSSVTDMSWMFRNADSFNQTLNNWDVSSVTVMISMFRDASLFNQPLNNWDVSSVTDMSFMFYNALSYNQDISGWCVEQIPTEPVGFSVNSILQNSFKPNWGAACEILSVSQAEKIIMTMYPNPANGVVHIDNRSSYDLESFAVYDMTGRMVKTQDTPSVNEVSITISDLPSGYYIVHLFTSDNTKLTKRLMVK